MEQKRLKTRQEILNEIDRKGISLAELSRSLGYDRATVYHVLHSNKPCRFGKAHKVAVLLGIKDGEIVD